MPTMSSSGFSVGLRLVAGLVCGALVLATHAGTARADDYPSKPIRLVVGYPPGGGNDVVAREIAPRLGKELGVAVIVDNRPGANGVIGTDFVARAAPDGYTLTAAGLTPLVLSAFTYKNLPYDSVKDFTGITTVATTPIIFAVSPSVPIHSLKELISTARDKPGKLNFSTVGTGGSTRLILELFNMTAGVKIQYISYKGGAQALSDLLGGHVDGMAIDFPVLYSLVKEGKLRGLAITSPQRSSLLPDLPTVSELGYPALTAGNWYAVMAPPHTPKAIVDKLNAALVTVANTPEMKKVFLADGLESMTQPSSAAFETFLKSELDRWGKVVKTSNIQAE
jgi:tripartite-type tricarboxylate transporter receptor subunit TctC